jgi:hypothetical protein
VAAGAGGCTDFVFKRRQAGRSRGEGFVTAYAIAGPSHDVPVTPAETTAAFLLLS